MAGDGRRRSGANGYPPDVYQRLLDQYDDQHAEVGRRLAARFAELAATRSAG